MPTMEQFEIDRLSKVTRIISIDEITQYKITDAFPKDMALATYINTQIFNPVGGKVYIGTDDHFNFWVVLYHSAIEHFTLCKKPSIEDVFSLWTKVQYSPKPAEKIENQILPGEQEIQLLFDLQTVLIDNGVEATAKLLTQMLCLIRDREK